VQNNETYIQAFAEAFEISDTKVIPTLEYQSITNWDSVGHMALISALEDSFDIMMEMDDIVDFSSFSAGKKILEKYGIQFNQ